MVLRLFHREIRSWLMDMDGVLVREELPIPGADQFVARLRELGAPFLMLTNNSMYTRRDLAARLRIAGLEVPEESIWTSALATARFLESQRPGGSAYVIGEAGLTTALHRAGARPAHARDRRRCLIRRSARSRSDDRHVPGARPHAGWQRAARR
jgi:HAD superfamily hydrolase (TIGR01450 family)